MILVGKDSGDADVGDKDQPTRASRRGGEEPGNDGGDDEGGAESDDTVAVHTFCSEVGVPAGVEVGVAVGAGVAGEADVGLNVSWSKETIPSEITC